MASRYTDIVNDVAANLQSVSGVGVVHKRFRYAKEPSKFKELFSIDGAGGKKEINGWEIVRLKVPEHKKGASFRHHVFAIHGYKGFEDETDTDSAFHVLVDDICETFRNAADGVAWFYGNGDRSSDAPAQVEEIDHRTIGGYLCHHVTIVVTITERIV